MIVGGVDLRLIATCGMFTSRKFNKIMIPSGIEWCYSHEHRLKAWVVLKAELLQAACLVADTTSTGTYVRLR